MSTWVGRQKKNTFKDLIRVENSNLGAFVDATLRNIEDGLGNVGPFQLGNAKVSFPTGKTLELLAGSTLNVAGTFQIGGVSLTPTAAQLNDVTNKLKVGVFHIPIPAIALLARTTNGAVFTVTETTTNKVMVPSFNFNSGTEQYVQFAFPAWKSWNESTVQFEFNWTADSGSGDVIWGAQGLARSDDDALDTAFGTAQEVTDTLLAAGDLHRTSTTAAITIGGTPAELDTLIFQIYRKAAAAGDTLNADARLLSVKMLIAVNAENDA